VKPNSLLQEARYLGSPQLDLNPNLQYRSTLSFTWHQILKSCLQTELNWSERVCSFRTE